MILNLKIFMISPAVDLMFDVSMILEPFFSEAIFMFQVKSPELTVHMFNNIRNSIYVSSHVFVPFIEK